MTALDNITENPGVVALYVLFGIVHGGRGYLDDALNDRDEDETLPEAFNGKHFLKAAFVGAIAGVVVASRGEDPSFGAFEAAMAVAVPVGDSLWNTIMVYVRAGRDAVDNHI